MITTTLNRIRAHSPCETSWKKLLKGLRKTKADDKPLRYSTIVRICGIEDAIWACVAEPQHDREWRLFAVWCARQVQHLMTDKRSIAALDVAERFANGEATQTELDAAWAAARAAAGAAVGEAAWAAAAADAWAAARAAAWDAPRAAAWAAVGDAVGDAAWAAESAAARAAAGDAQKIKFLEIVS